MLPIQCTMCIHYRGKRKCKAFPGKIPEVVFTGKHDHTKPFPGDGGVRFEPKEVVEEA